MSKSNVHGSIYTQTPAHVAYYLKFAPLSCGSARDVVLGDEFCRPERDLAGAVIEHGVRGVVVGGVRGLGTTILAIRHRPRVAIMPVFIMHSPFRFC